MATKSSSSTSPLLIALILIITFPFWIAIGGLVIGLIGGIFGITFGLLGAMLGGIFALITLPFKLLFGWGDWSCGFPFGFSGFHHNGFVWLAVLIFAALMINKRNK